MELLDDEGNLFGVVNVVDALVVLFVLAVVAAGAAFVLQPDPEPSAPNTATTNVTLDLGQQPNYVVTEINEGDTHSAGGQQLTITDVHLTPQDGQARVIVSAELRGTASGDSISYANAPPRLGRTLDITTNTYQVSGQVRAVGTNDTLAVEETTVVVSDTMPAADAQEVTQGDEIRVAGRTVATIENVTAYATGNPTERQVIAEVALDAHRQLGELRFGGSPVQRGQTVSLTQDAYTLNGQIERVGSGIQYGTADVVIEDVVDVETAERITEGDVATVAGHDTAEIESVTTYATQNPDRTRISVGVSLATLTGGERERFGSTPVQRGNTITLDTGSYELSGAIQRVGALEPRGSLDYRTVTIRMDGITDDMADAIRPGLSEWSGDTTIARVTAVRTEPEKIIATGDDGSVNVVDHPINRKVTVTADLRVRETTTGVTFKGQSIRQGSNVVIDLGSVLVDGTVIDVQG